MFSCYGWLNRVSHRLCQRPTNGRQDCGKRLAPILLPMPSLIVVLTQMLGNLKTPPEPFSDIIRTHFRLKAKSISTQLDDWLKKDDLKPTNADGPGYHPRESGSTSNNGLKKDIEDLKAAMKKLQEEAS